MMTITINDIERCVNECTKLMKIINEYIVANIDESLIFHNITKCVINHINNEISVKLELYNYNHLPKNDEVYVTIKEREFIEWIENHHNNFK